MLRKPIERENELLFVRYKYAENMGHNFSISQVKMVSGVRLEMVLGLEDQRKSLQVFTQFNSVLTLLNCNFPMQMDLQGLNHVQIDVNALQNLV